MPCRALSSVERSSRALPAFFCTYSRQFTWYHLPTSCQEFFDFICRYCKAGARKVAGTK